MDIHLPAGDIRDVLEEIDKDGEDALQVILLMIISLIKVFRDTLLYNYFVRDNGIEISSESLSKENGYGHDSRILGYIICP